MKAQMRRSSIQTSRSTR